MDHQVVFVTKISKFQNIRWSFHPGNIWVHFFPMSLLHRWRVEDRVHHLCLNLKFKKKFIWRRKLNQQLILEYKPCSGTLGAPSRSIFQSIYLFSKRQNKNYSTTVLLFFSLSGFCLQFSVGTFEAKINRTSSCLPTKKCVRQKNDFSQFHQWLK